MMVFSPLYCVFLVEIMRNPCERDVIVEEGMNYAISMHAKLN